MAFRIATDFSRLRLAAIDYSKKMKYNRYLNKSTKNADEADTHGEKIVLITNDCNQEGAPLLLQDIAKTLADEGITLTIISRRYGPLIVTLSEIGRVLVFRTKAKFRKIVKNLSEMRYNKVICNTTVNGDLVKILKQNGFNVITLVHELPDAIKSLNIEARARELAIYSDVVVFPSEYVYKKFLSVTQVTSRHTIKPQGIPLVDNYIYDKKLAKVYLRDKYGIPISNRIIINVGFGSLRKGYDMFLTMAHLCKNENITFMRVGNNQQEIYQNCLHKLGVKKLNNLVQTGFVDSPETLAFLYDASEVMALTSREDPYPSVVLHAFNYYTPVVAFKDAGGFSEIVTDDETGYLVEYGNYKKLLETIENLIFDDTKLTMLSNNCREVAKKHNLKEYVDEIVGELFEGQY
ncbi:MAG: glycosyltransferase family 4 protein [Clostridia bacterium]